MVDSSLSCKGMLSQSFLTVILITNVKTWRFTRRLEYSCLPLVGGCLQSYSKCCYNSKYVEI